MPKGIGRPRGGRKTPLERQEQQRDFRIRKRLANPKGQVQPPLVSRLLGAKPMSNEFSAKLLQEKRRKTTPKGRSKRSR